MTTLYVGNLPFSATESEVRGLFEQQAVANLNGFAMKGRPLRVNEARERGSRPPRSAPREVGGRW